MNFFPKPLNLKVFKQSLLDNCLSKLPKYDFSSPLKSGKVKHPEEYYVRPTLKMDKGHMEINKTQSKRLSPCYSTYNIYIK